MGRSSQKAGSKWETEVERFFNALPGVEWVMNWNDRQIPKTLKPADIQACINGISVLCECKTTKAASISFNVIGDRRYYDENTPKGDNNQRRTLMKHAASGGLSLIAIKRRFGNKSRTWLTSFQHWEYWRRELSRKSLPLADNKRPTSLLEVGRNLFVEPNSLSGGELQEARSKVLQIRLEAQHLPIWDYRFDCWF